MFVQETIDLWTIQHGENTVSLLYTGKCLPVSPSHHEGKTKLGRTFDDKAKWTLKGIPGDFNTGQKGSVYVRANVSPYTVYFKITSGFTSSQNLGKIEWI